MDAEGDDAPAAPPAAAGASASVVCDVVMAAANDTADTTTAPTQPKKRAPQQQKKPPAPKSLGFNREAFLRINFLYQAAHAALQQGSPDLARFYVGTLREIAKKLVLRIDPSIKRTICKKCSSLLVPGVTCTVRVRAERECHTVVTCTHCHAVRRFEGDATHTLWSERASRDGAGASAATQPSGAGDAPP